MVNIVSMKATKFPLPQYTLAQDLWNSISHGAGAVFIAIGGGFLIQKAALTGYWLNILSISIYVFGVFLMFTISCIYHGLAKNKGKQVLRVIDHDTVYGAIMATYVPYCLISLSNVPNTSFPWGYVLLGIVWAGCITGITLNSVNMKKFNILSISLYVILGSTICLAFYPLALTLPIGGLLLLVFGGVSFWIGAVLYGLGGKKNLWFHSVFHFFVLIGAILMFFSIYFYVL